MKFEDKKFCTVRTLCDRWEVGRSLIYDMVSKGQLKAWHPAGETGSKGLRIDVASVIHVEENGYIQMNG